MVAPPRGERGLKSAAELGDTITTMRRSPSWGAWIEIAFPRRYVLTASSRSPSWGAWIEI